MASAMYLEQYLDSKFSFFVLLQYVLCCKAYKTLAV